MRGWRVGLGRLLLAVDRRSCSAMRVALALSLLSSAMREACVCSAHVRLLFSCVKAHSDPPANAAVQRQLAKARLSVAGTLSAKLLQCTPPVCQQLGLRLKVM